MTTRISIAKLLESVDGWPTAEQTSVSPQGTYKEQDLLWLANRIADYGVIYRLCLTSAEHSLRGHVDQPREQVREVATSFFIQAMRDMPASATTRNTQQQQAALPRNRESAPSARRTPEFRPQENSSQESSRRVTYRFPGGDTDSSDNGSSNDTGDDDDDGEPEELHDAMNLAARPAANVPFESLDGWIYTFQFHVLTWPQDNDSYSWLYDAASTRVYRFADPNTASMFLVMAYLEISTYGNLSRDQRRLPWPSIFPSSREVLRAARIWYESNGNHAIIKRGAPRPRWMSPGPAQASDSQAREHPRILEPSGGSDDRIVSPSILSTARELSLDYSALLDWLSSRCGTVEDIYSGRDFARLVGGSLCGVYIRSRRAWVLNPWEPHLIEAVVACLETNSASNGSASHVRFGTLGPFGATALARAWTETKGFYWVGSRISGTPQMEESHILQHVRRGGVYPPATEPRLVRFPPPRAEFSITGPDSYQLSIDRRDPVYPGIDTGIRVGSVASTASLTLRDLVP